MKTHNHVMTVATSFTMSVIVASTAMGWKEITAQSVGGVRGEASGTSASVPQVDGARSAGNAQGMSSSQGTQLGGEKGEWTDGAMQPWTGENVDAAESTQEEDVWMPEWNPTPDDPPPDPFPTKVPPPQTQDVQGVMDSEGRLPRNINGLNGVNGLNGFNGINSINGLNGLNGINSVNGLNGVNGVNSINGLNGLNGINAVKTTFPSQAGRMRQKHWWENLERKPASMETVIPEAWRSAAEQNNEVPTVPDDVGGEEEESIDLMLFPDDEYKEESEGDQGATEEDVVPEPAPEQSETVFSRVRAVMEEVTKAISSLFSRLFHH